MSRADIEARLEELRCRIHKESPLPVSLSPPSGEVPRSIAAESAGYNVATQKPLYTSQAVPPVSDSDFLPRRGEEVISFGGNVHPIVEMLLRRSHRGGEEVTAPTGSSAPVTYHERSQVEKQSSSAWNAALRPQERAEPQHHPPRNVLWIYPRNLGTQQILECLKLAEASFLRSSDHMLVCWAGESKDEAARSIAESPVHPLEVDFNPEAHDEASVTLRDSYPFIYDFAMEAGFGKRKIKAKLEPHAGLRWMLQQELNPPAEKAPPYDLVILPCLKPEMGADAAFEEFLLMTSPSPVILLRSPL